MLRNVASKYRPNRHCDLHMRPRLCDQPTASEDTTDHNKHTQLTTPSMLFRNSRWKPSEPHGLSWSVITSSRERSPCDVMPHQNMNDVKAHSEYDQGIGVAAAASDEAAICNDATRADGAAANAETAGDVLSTQRRTAAKYNRVTTKPLNRVCNQPPGQRDVRVRPSPASTTSQPPFRRRDRARSAAPRHPRHT